MPGPTSTERSTHSKPALGRFVDLNKPDFVGKAVLERADRSCRTWGFADAGGTSRSSAARSTATASRSAGCARPPGRRTCSAASPIARMDDPADGPGTQLDVESHEGAMLRGELCTLPMYDPERLIPRGLLVDIPDRCD